MMWSSALPDFLSHLVMYGTSGWSLGTTDEYGGDVFVMWCITRCLGVGRRSVPSACLVLSGECVWKSPTKRNVVFVYLLDMVSIAFLISGIQDCMLLCWTS